MTTSNTQVSPTKTSQIYKKVAQQAGLSEKTVKKVVGILRAVMIEELKYKGIFRIQGFFTAKMVQLPAKESYSPITGAKVFTPARLATRMKPSYVIDDDIYGRLVSTESKKDHKKAGREYKQNEYVRARLTSEDNKRADFLINEMLNGKLEIEDDEEDE